MCLLAIKFPVGIRKAIVALQKIATSTFLGTGCLISIFYCFPFEKHSILQITRFYSKKIESIE